jgi:hypothetical protein
MHHAPPPPPALPGASLYPPPAPLDVPGASPSWLEPIPRANYYGHAYNITGSYYIIQPDGTRLFVSDLRYNDSVKGIVMADGYYTIKKGGDGYWHYVNFYNGSLSGRAGIDKPAPSDSASAHHPPPSSPSPAGHTYVPRPDYIGPDVRLSSVSGTVTDASGAGVPDARIAVYHSTYNRLTGEYLDLSLALAPSNPQATRNDTYSLPGIYAVPYLPPGTYRVVAEKDGCKGFAIAFVDPRKGTVTADIKIKKNWR